MSEKQPLSIRLAPELTARLAEVAARLRMKKHTLAQLAVEAAIEAVERNEGRLVLPIEFEVRSVPSVVGVRYPKHESEASFVEERPRRKKI